MTSSTRSTRLIVHGGAWDISDALVDDHISGVRSAIEQVAPRLEAGMNAIDTVEAAVNALEAHPVFDAGRGSFLNSDGEIEIDAMIVPGRVGDTPLIGSGTYADNSSGGVSVTGWGEAIMKVLLAKTICDSLTNKTANAAIQNALNILRTRVSGLAGAIAISRTGEYGLAHNTPRMAFAYQERDGDIKAGIRLT